MNFYSQSAALSAVRDCWLSVAHVVDDKVATSTKIPVSPRLDRVERACAPLSGAHAHKTRFRTTAVGHTPTQHDPDGSARGHCVSLSLQRM